MDRDREHLRALLALLVQLVEGVDALLREVRRFLRLYRERRDVLALDWIRERNERTALRLQSRRLIVERILAGVLDTGGREIVGRLECLAEAGAQPSNRTLACVLLEGIERPLDHL